MVYNRCIGTRYCSNNCPYKVRRFNFFGYAPRQDQQPQALRHNPQVTVRSRGVMEKCTFCVQRIRAAEIDARVTDTPLETDSFTTACAAACASQAIVFGNLADPNSRVSQLKAIERHYGMLAELGTRPRVGYLPRVINRRPQEPQA
jgi:molybdopterin-containing oxidoreductase family iron-sulfur binding subunit